MAWVLDLDGVVWLAEQPIDGAAAAVERLRARGDRVLFATNNSWARLEDQEAKLDRMGIPAAGDVVTSAMAAATLVDAGERVLVCGGPGVVQAVAARGAEREVGAVPVRPEAPGWSEPLIRGADGHSKNSARVWVYAGLHRGWSVRGRAVSRIGPCSGAARNPAPSRA
jgi:ribonucleotide monophosphatase NagD (HAD superfamily)